MVSNDNGDGGSVTRLGTGLPQFEETALSGSAASVAMGLACLDAAQSISLSMQNAVVEQQNAWTMARAVTSRAVNLLLDNSVAGRAVDLLLNRSAAAGSGSGKAANIPSGSQD